VFVEMSRFETAEGTGSKDVTVALIKELHQGDLCILYCLFIYFL